MNIKTSWEKRTMQCPEEKRLAELLIKWQDDNGMRVIKSISCDNPRLADLDNWGCHWTCWEAVQNEISD